MEERGGGSSFYSNKIISTWVWLFPVVYKILTLKKHIYPVHSLRPVKGCRNNNNKSLGRSRHIGWLCDLHKRRNILTINVDFVVCTFGTIMCIRHII
jgi:hypothetical protein